MMNRLVLPRDIWAALDGHFREAAPSEEGAFLLLHEGKGQSSRRLLAHELLLPPSDAAWERRGDHFLRPSGKWLSAAIGAAIETDSGLAFVHSHPDPRHPAMLSTVDRTTSREWSTAITPTLGRPFSSLVWANGSLAGWIFDPAEPSQPLDLHRGEALGGDRRIDLSIQDVVPRHDEPMDDRQRRALGARANLELRQLSVAVVGAGGTGSPLIEQLARMGVARIDVVDGDTLDDPSNLRRVVGSRPADVAARTPKAQAARHHIESLELGVVVGAVARDVRTGEALRKLIDADVIISTTDTHSSRAFLNQISTQYWIPLIDVGVAVGTTTTGAISGMPAEVRVVLPDSACLLCRGTIDPNRIRAENLPVAELDRERAEGYVQGLGEPVPSIAALNGLAASLAALTLLRLCSTEGLIDENFIVDAWELYVQSARTPVDPQCLCWTWRGQGDNVPVPLLEP